MVTNYVGEDQTPPLSFNQERDFYNTTPKNKITNTISVLNNYTACAIET